jgi:hypothetical protein
MRLHSNVITPQQILDALSAEQAMGRIAPSVRFKVRTQHGSQSHARAYEIQLEATAQVKGDGRRAGNSGSYGAMDGSNGYAATYDEWGWLMAHLYSIDPDAVWGSVKHPQYANRDHFDHITGLTYNPAILLTFLDTPTPDGGDPYPYVAPGSSRVGRYGANRHDEQITPWGVPYYLHAPRTAEWVRSFAHLPANQTIGV